MVMNNKGISPVIAVVLLIAIAVISAVGVWYWVGGLASKPGGVKQARTGYTVEQCSVEGLQSILVRNTGSVPIRKSALLYNSSNEQVGYVAFNATNPNEYTPPLEVEETSFILVKNSTGNAEAGILQNGDFYTVIEGGLPTVQFTC